MPHDMDEMMKMGKKPMMDEPEEDEKNEPVKALHVEIMDDGFNYRVMGGGGGHKDYPTKDIDELIGWIKDDLGSAHMKDEKGGFKRLVHKIMSGPGFKPRHSGQSKEEAANAVAASVKDKKYGKSWRED